MFLIKKFLLYIFTHQFLLEMSYNSILPFDILNIIFNLLNVKELNGSRYVCNDWNKCINLNPMLFWFKNPLKIYYNGLYIDPHVKDNIIDIFEQNDIIIHSMPPSPNSSYWDTRRGKWKVVQPHKAIINTFAIDIDELLYI